MPNLLSIAKNDIKDSIQLPEGSIFDMEEVYGKQKTNSRKRKLVRLDPTHPSSHTAYD